MPDADPALLVTHWRARAAELLAKAETMADPDARQEMRETAVAYERLEVEFEKEFPSNL
jgi:hypothetical protein